MERANINDTKEENLSSESRVGWKIATVPAYDVVFQKYVMLLKNGYQISNELIEAIWECSRLMVYDKKELIVTEGSKINSLFLVIDGFCACFYYREDGQESICCFSTSGEFCMLPHAFMSDKKSLLNIKAMTKSTLLCISRENYTVLKEQYPEFNLLTQLIFEKTSIEYELHYYYLRRYDAKERIRIALGAPKIQYLQKHIPQCYIASYLNIAPETFSSIKRKLFRKV